MASNNNNVGIPHGVNVVGMELLAKFFAEEKGNVFISPLSIHVALSMARHGACKDTLSQFNDVLRDGHAQRDQKLANYNKFLDTLTSSDPKVTLAIANGIFTKKPLRPQYVDELKDQLNSMAKELTGGVGEINKWVATKTDGMIKDLLKELPPNLVAVLVNAVYFKGFWKSPFDTQNTAPMDFKDESGAKVRGCSMMMAEMEDVKYYDKGTCQVLSLPYGSKGQFEATIILPRPGKATVHSILAAANKDPAKWVQEHTPKGTAWGDVWLPRFRMEYGTVSLKESLKAMGLTDAFDDGKANFAYMTSNQIWIADVLHKAVVEFSEKGTKAAAATAVLCVDECEIDEPPEGFSFKADHPFVLLITMATRPSTILFVGTVTDPGDGKFAGL